MDNDDLIDLIINHPANFKGVMQSRDTWLSFDRESLQGQIEFLDKCCYLMDSDYEEIEAGVVQAGHLLKEHLHMLQAHLKGEQQRDAVMLLMSVDQFLKSLDGS